MAAEQGIKSLKIESRNKIPLYPADWIAGVDHTDSDSTGDDDDSQDGDCRVPTNAPYQHERDVNNEEIFDPIDEDELDELLADENAVDHRAVDVEIQCNSLITRFNLRLKIVPMCQKTTKLFGGAKHHLRPAFHPG